MKYPRDAKVIKATSSLNRNRRSSGDLSNVSQRYDFQLLFGSSWMEPIAELLELSGPSSMSSL